MWALVHLMGNVHTAGEVFPDSSLGVPMIRFERPEVAADGDREKIRAEMDLLGAGAIYKIRPCSEESAMQSLRDSPKPQDTEARK